MKKIILISMAVLVFVLCAAASLTSVSQIDGNALHTIQNAWVIADETTSAGTEPSALDKDGERTYKQVLALIAAASSGDEEITIVALPSKWNSIRLRNINITKDSGSVVDHIYFGTLGGETDCDLTYAAQLTWTTGDQDSMYHQITFTLGGADGAAYVPQPGDTVTGNSSGETAVIISIVETASTWTAGTAAGTVTYKSETGTFTNSETVSIKRANKVLASDAYKHAASDLVQFEYSDTLVIVAKAWGASWSSVSPADDTTAECEIDKKNADIMVVVTSTCTADSKLLMTGL